MRRLFIPTFLAITCLALPTAAQTTNPKLETAKKQTAIALRAVATVTESSSLARLGDFENARKLSSKAAVAPYIAQEALQKDDFATAEREIKLVSDSWRKKALWLQLSKRYHQLKRPADARRTAFYAANQAQLDQTWASATEWLCEIGEKSAARRLIIAAKQQQPAPIPFPAFGSAPDYVAITAARCGFDDIALKNPSDFTSRQLVIFYASKNRDDMARRVIELSEIAMKASLQKLTALSKSNEKQGLQDLLEYMHAQEFVDLALAQLSRGDSKAAALTYREIEALQILNKTESDGLDIKLRLLTGCEKNAHWELADDIEKSMRGQIQNLLANTSKTAPSKRSTKKGLQSTLELFERSHFSALEVLFNPAKFSRQQRLTAMARIKPQALQYAVAHPEKKAGVYLGLSRAQRLLDDAAWRGSLEIAQSTAFENIKHGNNWLLLPIIAEEWQLTGNPETARLMGNHILKNWNNWGVSRLAEIKHGGKMKGVTLSEVLDELSLIVAHSLGYCGLTSQAIDVLFQHNKQQHYVRAQILAIIARQYQGAPPRQLLALPPEIRLKALRNWADGLAPDPTFTGEPASTDSYSFYQKLLW